LAGLGGQWAFLGGWFNKVKPMPILAQVKILAGEGIAYFREEVLQLCPTSPGEA
jgi:hypothetical protein